MKTIFFILLSILIFSSCGTQNRIERKCWKAKMKYDLSSTKWGCPHHLDSIVVQSHVIIKDTTIYVPIPGQSVHDSIPVIITKGLMNSPVSKLETTYSLSKAWVEDGLLKHTLEQKASSVAATIPGAIHTTTSNTIQTVKVPYYVDRPVQKPLSWWQKLFIWSGAIAWFTAGLYIAIRFYKFKTG